MMKLHLMVKIDLKYFQLQQNNKSARKHLQKIASLRRSIVDVQTINPRTRYFP